MNRTESIIYFILPCKYSKHQPQVKMTEVQTSMLFLEPWDNKIENPFLRNNPLEGLEGQNFEYERSAVVVTDTRKMKDQFNLDDNGFAFVNEPQSATPEIVQKMRKKDKETIENIVCPSIERLIKETTGASKVVIFDYTVRQRIKELAGTSPEGREQPAFSV